MPRLKRGRKDSKALKYSKRSKRITRYYRSKDNDYDNINDRDHNDDGTMYVYIIN